MVVNFRIYILLILNHLALISQGQKEANNWYFGNGAGVTFNSGKPELLPKNNIGTSEGCATISNAKGQFLFYSYGEYLYDSSLTITPNGSNLKGQSTVTQSAIFIPKPDSIGKYYLITNNGTVFSRGGLYFSEIDLKMNNGRGDIISSKKNILIGDSSLEKFTVTRHGNGKDYWIVMHKSDNDTICCYLLTKKGISSNPIKSKTGYFIAYGNGRGQMKISPDGKKIAYNILSNVSVIGDFNNFTGKATNFWKFNEASYGCEFSVNSQFLYISPPNYFLQYNAKASNATLFANSKTVVHSNSLTNGNAMQLGPDGKIYIAKNDSLSAILYPDSAGYACKLKSNYLHLKGASASMGLPSFVPSLLLPNQLTITRNCLQDSTFFYPILRSDPDSILWDFGDTASKKLNLSKQWGTVYHKFSKAGTFKIKWFVYYKYSIDTISFLVNIKNVKPQLGKDTIYCNDFLTFLSGKRRYLNYTWNTGSRSEYLSINTGGTYILKALDSLLCTVSDTIVIKNPKVVANFSFSDSGMCLRNNFFKFKETSKYIGDARLNSIYTFFDGSMVNDSLSSIQFPVKGIFSIKLLAKSQLGCQDSMLKSVQVYAQNNPLFGINNDKQCFKSNKFYFTNKTTDTITNQFQWDLGDQTFEHTTNVKGKYYTKDSIYSIQLISISPHNCRDTITKSITVLPNLIANFTNGLACNLTKTQFNYTGSKPILNYRWLFGSNDSAFVENPLILLDKIKNYKVFLKVISKAGCEDTITKNVEIRPQAIARFNVADVCENDSIKLTNNSINALQFIWRFGDGNSSSKFEPRHHYNTGGISITYNVTLIAMLANGCSDSMVQQASVNANPKTDFTFTTNGKTVTFKAPQIGNTTYKWYFGDGDSSNTVNPTHTYKLYPFGIIVCLKVTNAASCVAQTSKKLDIGDIHSKKALKIKITPNPSSGLIYIEIPNGSEKTWVKVYNSVGSEIEINNLIYYKNTWELNLKGNGIYWIRIWNGSNSYYEKVLVAQDLD